MGYEVTYHYHLRGDDGKYKTEETLVSLLRVGKNTDESVPLSKVASSIIKYLSRRDIWVVDVEIHEYIRKPVRYKECKDGKGITIKNKKFLFGAAGSLIESDESEVVEEAKETTAEKASPAPISTNIEKPKESSKIQEVVGDNDFVLFDGKILKINRKQVLERVVFDPPVTISARLNQLNYGLTIGSVYSVHYRIQQNNRTLNVVANDKDEFKIIPEECFITYNPSSSQVNQPQNQSVGQLNLRSNYFGPTPASSLHLR